MSQSGLVLVLVLLVIALVFSPPFLRKPDNLRDRKLFSFLCPYEHICFQFEDLTEPWTSFVEKRHLEFNQQKERHVRVLGQDAFDSLGYFYTVTKMVFVKGLTGGCRIIATKPTI